MKAQRKVASPVQQVDGPMRLASKVNLLAELVQKAKCRTKRGCKLNLRAGFARRVSFPMKARRKVASPVQQVNIQIRLAGKIGLRVAPALKGRGLIKSVKGNARIAQGANFRIRPARWKNHSAGTAALGNFQTHLVSNKKHSASLAAAVHGRIRAVA